MRPRISAIRPKLLPEFDPKIGLRISAIGPKLLPELNLKRVLEQGPRIGAFGNSIASKVDYKYVPRIGPGMGPGMGPRMGLEMGPGIEPTTGPKNRCFQQLNSPKN